MCTTSRHGIKPMRQPTASHTTALTHRAQQRQAPRRRLGHKRRTARSFYACTNIHMYAYVYTCAWSTRTQNKKNSVPLPHGACCVHTPLPLAMFITVLVHTCMQSCMHSQRACMHACTHTHTHTHTLPYRAVPSRERPCSPNPVFRREIALDTT